MPYDPSLTGPFNAIDAVLRHNAALLDAERQQVTTLRGRVSELEAEVERLKRPPAPEPEPQPEPPAGDKPERHNTGPRGTLKKVSGDLEITEDGTVITGEDRDGSYRIKASNVVVRNCRAHSLKFYDEEKYGSHRNLLIEDCEFTDPGSSTGIVGGHMIVRRTEVHHLGSDGINVHANAVIEGNYIHSLGMSDGSHADGISASSPDGKPVLGVVIRGNNIDMPAKPGHKSNACMYVGQMGTLANPMVVERNWLNGGGYSVNSGIDGAVILYRDNLFGRDARNGVRRTNTGEKYEPGTWVNNRYADTGALIP